jgi:type II secretory pathway pseudopilin PulG
MTSRPNGAGLTLIEVIVSFGILGALLLAFSGLFLSLFRSSLQTSDRQEGVTVIQAVLEAQRNCKIYPPPAGNQTILLYNRDASTPTEYIYSITTQTVNNRTGLYQVDVDCWWNKGQQGAGTGQVHLRMGRLMTL